jgi:hypothetical protein
MSKTAMAGSSHAAALAARHAELEAKLERESQRPFPDAGILAQLKKAKLKLKDAMRPR